jgi:enoyl-CoA hydratase/carnithine racemase
MAALDRAEEDEAVVVLAGREKFFSADSRGSRSACSPS